MRNKVAKRIRKHTDSITVGLSARATKKAYRQFKKEYKQLKGQI